MQKDDILKTNEVSTTPRGINLMVKVTPSSNFWLFTTIYASNTYANRRNLWQQLRAIPQNYNRSWLVDEDFNEVLRSRDKKWGNCISSPRANLFQQCINHILIDMGFKGNKYTWTNMTYRNKVNLSQIYKIDALLMIIGSKNTPLV